MGGEHETAEAHHGRQAVHEHRHDGRARHQRAAVIAALDEPHDDVETELGGRAENERDPEDVAEVQLDVEEPHEAGRPRHAERQRRQREQRLADPPQHEEREHTDENDRVHRSLLVGALHQPDRLMGDHRRARDLGIHRAHVVDETRGPVAVPDVDSGMDLQQEVAAVADELAPDLRRHVREPDHARVEVRLKPLERGHEVAIDLALQERQRRLAHRAVRLPESHHELADIVAQRGQPSLGVAGRRLAGGDVEAALQRLERGQEPIDVDRLRPRHAHGRHDRREVVDDLLLLRLIVGDEQQRGVDLGDCRQRAERVLLAPELVERRRARQRGEARAPGGREDLLLPDDRLGALGLEVEQVVVEADFAEGVHGDGGQQRRGRHHGLGMTGDPVDERDVHALEANRARDGDADAIEMPPVDQHQHGREHEHHRHPRQDQRGAGDEAQFLEPAEVGEDQHVERGGGGDRAQQHPGPAPHRGDLDRLAQVAAEEELLLVAEQIIDAVIDADADDDGNEHHGEERQVADHERGHADRPGQGECQDDQHEERLAHAQERRDQQAEREGEGKQRRALAVAERRRHLVVRQRRLAGDADLDVGELGAQRGHGGAHALDRVAIAREAAVLRRGLGEDEEQALIVGQEVAGAFAALTADGEEAAPRRAVRRRAIEAPRDLRHHVVDEAQIERALGAAGARLEPEVEQAGDECLGDRRRDTVHELIERGPFRELLHELLVVEDALANLLEPVGRQVQQRPSLELLGIDAVIDAVQRHAVDAQLTHEAVGVDRRLGQRRRLDGQHQIVEIAELLAVLDVFLDEALALR